MYNAVYIVYMILYTVYIAVYTVQIALKALRSIDEAAYLFIIWTLGGKPLWLFNRILRK